MPLPAPHGHGNGDAAFVGDGDVMARRLFGTDGIRGTANTEPMTPETALKVAMAVGESLHNGSHKHLVVIGKDTRLSGYMLEPALTAGFITMGMDVVLVGPLPTPAIAMLTRSLRADIGVVISASHNPYADNGIKLFGPDGYKLSDDFEAKIEAGLDKGPLRRAKPADLGRAKRLDDAGGRYIEFVQQSFPKGPPLDRARVVGHFAGGALVATVMSNLGLERCLAGQGIGLHRTAVGDRYVVEKMRSLGCNLGGEQSGHIILSDYATTGDGLIAALQVLAAIVETGRHASEVCRLFEPVPQLLRNVRFGQGRPLETRAVKHAIAAAEARLG